MFPGDVFFQAENAPKKSSAGAMPRTPLTELTPLPQLAGKEASTSYFPPTFGVF